MILELSLYKLNLLADLYGYDSWADMNDFYQDALVRPGMCVNPGCDHHDDMEAGGVGWCTECNSQTLMDCVTIEEMANAAKE